jgi:hypothetical protein
MTCGHGAVLSEARLMFAPHNTVTTLAPAHAARTSTNTRHTSGEATIESLGWELFRLLLDVASGRCTWAEH